MTTTRRDFIKRSLSTGLGLIVAPTIVPASVFGPHAPSNRILIGAIGTGRISRDHDMPGVWKYDDVRIVATSDLDRNRLAESKTLVEGYYSKKMGKPYTGVTTYENYQDLLANKEIDGVLISTPDHWHAKMAIDAVRAGKDVYLQKPTSLTIEEGRKMSDAVNASGRILQIGSQQRSMEQFRVACELVRNGRIGQLQRIEIRLPGDPSGGNPQEMPIPQGFNYDAWLGQTPYVPYTVDRVHPQKGYGRPGWLRCEQFGAGMITGWGAHHFDIAHWAMDKEYSGPVEISGKAEFPTSGLWNVHGYYETEMLYDNGVIVTGTTDSKEKPNGVLFTGTEGWIFVSRGAYSASANDPASNATSQALQASDPKILKSVIGEGEVHLYRSSDHHGNWLESIRTRKQNITPAEVAHRSCSACLLQHIAMKLNRKLYWDPVLERFKNDDEANAMIARPHRPPYNF
ncbi:gfo/Idh/MocA family oxidoreductase [Parabacteroides sp. 52]|uniref:Gfo/Idh/MocA family protein n=1 Tax=unclassified Parabacteroides TaxID=2649774 RepID=UPI0013D2BAC1|nr:MULTISPECIES: Gfo/Idh/MocA family oxidoreductase [unclassified Parabacteroides]MDH6535556.1 myo-inositol 2-dehydrogenase/D-chiro-inositol 1-dehydrogenase [Parabacteroides sp. PM5-20]NDV56035.1 gfo/Idh/MocA family oxidoreductase [Parabacteroides sp. 52]